MDEQNKKLIDSLISIEKLILSSDNLVHVTYPVIGDPKLLLRALEDIGKAIVNNISIILRYEFIFNKVGLSSDKEKNLDLFFEKLYSKYGLTKSDVKSLKGLISLRKKQKESVFEFTRDKEAVFYDDDMNLTKVGQSSLEVYLEVSKRLLLNTNKILGFRKV